MLTKSATHQNAVYEVLRQVTGESATDAALPIALKDLLRYKKETLRAKISAFEKKYGMDYVEFELACDDGRIQDPFSYEVEKDTWDWEAALSDQKTIETFQQWLD